MSTFQTGQWVRRGRNIVILLNSQHPSHAVEAESWAHEDESKSGLHDTAWVQRSLNQVMGSGLVVDGIAGSRTRAAVMAFQRSQGLTVDGIAGSNTQAALEAQAGDALCRPSRSLRALHRTGRKLRRGTGRELADPLSVLGESQRLDRPAQQRLARPGTQREAMLGDVWRSEVPRQVRRTGFQPLRFREAEGRS